MKSQIPAGQFKAQCLQLMDRVHATRRELVITKRGKPIAKLVPIEEKAAVFFDCMQGTAAIVGDVLEPAVPAEDWESAR